MYLSSFQDFFTNQRTKERTNKRTNERAVKKCWALIWGRSTSLRVATHFDDSLNGRGRGEAKVTNGGKRERREGKCLGIKRRVPAIVSAEEKKYNSHAASVFLSVCSFGTWEHFEIRFSFFCLSFFFLLLFWLFGLRFTVLTFNTRWRKHACIEDVGKCVRESVCESVWGCVSVCVSLNWEKMRGREEDEIECVCVWCHLWKNGF